MSADGSNDSEDAERQLRAEIANVHDPALDAFLVRVPAMRTSDLIGFIADSNALVANLHLSSRQLDDARPILFVALFAIKDEIDRRLPIPEAPR